MFCGSLIFYYVMNKVLPELVAQVPFCNTFQSFITKKCLFGVLLKNVSSASHNPAFFCFPCPLHFIFSQTPRAGLGSTLVYLSSGSAPLLCHFLITLAC